MVELQALSLVGTWVNFWRLRLRESDFKTTFPSSLVLVEAPTGTGKNAAYRFMLSYVFGFPFRFMEGILFERESALRAEFVELINAKYPVIGDSALDKKNEKERLKAIQDHDSKKRALGMLSSDDGSYEGFAFDRAYLERLGFGAPTIRVDEYGDKLSLMKRAAYLLSFYNKLLELVDYDELGAKSIKDRGGATPGSSGMGITLYYTLSHPDTHQKEEIKRAVLKSIGRRGFLLRETNQTIKLHAITPPSLEIVEVFQHELQTLTESLYERFKASPSSRDRFVQVDAEAQAWYRTRANALALELQSFRSSAAPSTVKDVRCALMADLDRKVMRIACLLAVFNHGECDPLVVTVRDLEDAQDIVTRSYESAQSFFDMSEYSNANEIIGLLQAKGDAGASALELLTCKAFWGMPKRGFQDTVFKVMMDEIAPDAEAAGYALEHFKLRKRDFYKVRALDADDTILYNSPAHDTAIPISTDATHAFTYSSRPGLDPAQSSGFVEHSDMAGLPDILCGENLYSACTFKDGERKQENFQKANLIILDFDEGLTLEAAKSTFKDYTYIIATTRNHQKIKKDAPACDRFRVILFSDVEFTDRETFRAFMEYMTERFQSDPACKDAARTYFGNPGALVTLNDARLFPTSKILKQIQLDLERAKREKVQYVQQRENKSRANAMDNFMLTDAHGRAQDAITFIRSLPQDDSATTPIKCPWHSDGHASAFASHRSNGGLQVSCVVCAVTKFISP